MIAYKYHQTGQIVILERNLKKRGSNMQVKEEQRASQTLNERVSQRALDAGAFIKKQNTSSSLNDEEKEEPQSAAVEGKRSASQSTKSTNNPTSNGYQNENASGSDFDNSSQGSYNQSAEKQPAARTKRGQEVDAFTLNNQIKLARIQDESNSLRKMPTADQCKDSSAKVKAPKKKSVCAIF